MAIIRIPVAKAPQFKAYCKRFSTHFEKQTGTRLRGNALLNLVARAAGHKSYTALLVDAKTYGTGKFDWDVLPASLYKRVADSTNTSPEACLHSLSSALLDDHEILRDLSSKIGNSINPFSNVLPAITLSTPQHDHWKNVSSEYGRIFESDSAEVEISDIIETNDNPVIDLDVLSSAGLTDSDKGTFCKLLVTQYMDLPEDVRKKVVFLGTAELLNDLYTSMNIETQQSFFNNPSFSKILMSTWTLGECFAENPRPKVLDSLFHEIKGFIPGIKKKMEEEGARASEGFGLHPFTTAMYSILSNTNGFSSRDLAGYLLDNGRKFNVPFSFGNQTIEKYLTLIDYRPNVPSNTWSPGDN